MAAHSPGWLRGCTLGGHTAPHQRAGPRWAQKRKASGRAPGVTARIATRPTGGNVARLDCRVRYRDTERKVGKPLGASAETPPRVRFVISGYTIRPASRAAELGPSMHGRRLGSA